MPFDPYVRSTSDALAVVGIVPVSSDDLTRHKEAQIRSHPPSLLYPMKARYAFFGCLGTLLIGSFFVIIASTIVAGLNLNAVIAYHIATMCMFGGIIGLILAIVGILVAAMVVVRGPAKWVEYDVLGQFLVQYPDDIGAWVMSSSSIVGSRTVPEPIMALLRRVVDAYPSAIGRIGLLMQHGEILDPYLQVKIGAEWECLAVWENERIDYIATH